jgi:hypothetical protein
MAPIPAAGRAARPSLNMRKTSSSMRLEVASSVSRKMPPKKGRKNVSTIRWLKPKLRRASRAEISGRAQSSSSVPCRTWWRRRAIASLSARLPIGARSVAGRVQGWRKGSETRWNRLLTRTSAPGENVPSRSA